MPDMSLDKSCALINTPALPAGNHAMEADSWDYQIYGEPFIAIAAGTKDRYGSKGSRNQCWYHPTS